LKTIPSSKAKLKNKNCSPITPSAPPLSLSKLIDEIEEFCDLQILLLEAGHKLSKAEQQVVEEMTTKLSGAEGLEEMVLQPGPVLLTGLGRGPSWGCGEACRAVNY
jgi:hypothetical protein